MGKMLYEIDSSPSKFPVDSSTEKLQNFSRDLYLRIPKPQHGIGGWFFWQAANVQMYVFCALMGLENLVQTSNYRSDWFLLKFSGRFQTGFFQVSRFLRLGFAVIQVWVEMSRGFDVPKMISSDPYVSGPLLYMFVLIKAKKIRDYILCVSLR